MTEDSRLRGILRCPACGSALSDTDEGLLLGDVARVVDGFAEADERVRLNGEPAVVVRLLTSEPEGIVDIMYGESDNRVLGRRECGHRRYTQFAAIDAEHPGTI